MHQSKGFIKQGEEHIICKLNKGIDSLHQSETVWHQTLGGELAKISLKPSDADPTVYFHFKNNGSIQMAVWYVNDGLLASNTTTYMDKMINKIRGSSNIEDLGEPDQLLGIQITRD